MMNIADRRISVSIIAMIDILRVSPRASRVDDLIETNVTHHHRWIVIFTIARIAIQIVGGVRHGEDRAQPEQALPRLVSTTIARSLLPLPPPSSSSFVGIAIVVIPKRVRTYQFL
jgi:hypothetical protein